MTRRRSRAAAAGRQNPAVPVKEIGNGPRIGVPESAIKWEVAMRISHRLEGPVLVVALEGELDLATAPSVRGAVDDLLDRHRPGELVMDLAGVTFLDSSGLAVVLGRYRRLEGTGRSMRIVGARPVVRSVLEVAGVGQIMQIAGAPPDGAPRHNEGGQARE